MQPTYRIVLRHPNGQEEDIERQINESDAYKSALNIQLNVIEDQDRRRYLRGQVVRLHTPHEKLIRVQKLLRDIDPQRSYGLVLCLEDASGLPILVTDSGRPMRKSAMVARAEMTTVGEESSASSVAESSNASDSDFEEDEETTTFASYAASRQTPQVEQGTPVKRHGGIRTRRQRTAEADSDTNSDDGRWRTDHWAIQPQKEPLLIPFPDDGTCLIGKARWYRRTW